MSRLKTDTRIDAVLRRTKQMLGRSLYLPTEAPHFQFNVEGDWFVFCAIHKNASSSIRGIVERASDLKTEEDQSIFNFLFQNHLVRHIHEIERARYVMVFVRQPVDRVVSCFQNKFIQRKGNHSIFRDYAKVVGGKPEQASLREFVHDYLRSSFQRGGVRSRRNRHIYTQYQQLLPVNYDIVIGVEQFDLTMMEIGLDDLVTDRVNATTAGVRMPGAWRMTAADLHAHYLRWGETPTKESLLTDELIQEINHLYRADIQAFGHLFHEEKG